MSETTNKTTFPPVVEKTLEQAYRHLRAEPRFLPIQGRMENGTRVISYSFSADTTPSPMHDGQAVNIEPIDQPEHKAAVEQALRSIEQVANLRFEEAADPATANIRFYQGDLIGSVAYSYGYFKGTGDDLREIMMSRSEMDPQNFTGRRRGYGTLVHEILHSLGLSHPDRDIDHLEYDTDMTIMVNHSGESGVEGLSVLDAAVLQHIYGSPREANPASPRTIDLQEVLKSLMVHSPPGAKLEIDAPDYQGALTIGLDEPIGKQVKGTLQGPFGARAGAPPSVMIGMGFTLSTPVLDVELTDGTPVSVTLTGNDLPNRLKGGDAPDSITALGGGDVLAGGGGRDAFIFTPKSGMDNLILDLNARPGQGDEVHTHSIEKATLHYRDDLPAPASTRIGTEICLYDYTEQCVATAMVPGVLPKDVAKLLYNKTRDMPLDAAIERSGKGFPLEWTFTGQDDTPKPKPPAPDTPLPLPVMVFAENPAMEAAPAVPSTHEIWNKLNAVIGNLSLPPTAAQMSSVPADSSPKRTMTDDSMDITPGLPHMPPHRKGVER